MKQLKNVQSGFSAVEGILILVVVGILGFTGYYVWHAKQNADKNLTTDSSTTPTYNKKSTDSSDGSVQALPQPNLTPGPGADWNTYTNKQLGFSIQIPKQLNASTACKKTGNTYTTTGGTAPAGVFQDGSNFYVDATVTYQLTNEKDDTQGIAQFYGCKKVATTGALITKSQKVHDLSVYSYIPLPFTVTKASSEQDVKNWVKSEFGTDVWVDSITANKGGWQDVNLQCDHAKSTCLNYGFQLRYYSAKQRLVYLVQGQSAKLMSPDQKSSYDEQVFASFKLL
ncbi:MAG TPA: hypothetical protein VLG47_01125 [Candidatus Saccharimonadales bacterium]|nr:hypothetical protein [Candidatus Saccharimonadales bacterium]